MQQCIELGWVFPDDETIRDDGYSPLTQPEGSAPTRYLWGLRDTVLGGRPLASAMDFHGRQRPAGLSGAVRRSPPGG